MFPTFKKCKYSEQGSRPCWLSALVFAPLPPSPPQVIIAIRWEHTGGPPGLHFFTSYIRAQVTLYADSFSNSSHETVNTHLPRKENSSQAQQQQRDHRLCLGSWGWRKWQFEYLSHTFCLPLSYKSSVRELVAGTEYSKPESVKYLQLRRSRKEFVYTLWACVTKKISLRRTGNMINSKTTSPTMLCYQEIMNDCRAARSCSNYTHLPPFI